MHNNLPIKGSFYDTATVNILTTSTIKIWTAFYQFIVFRITCKELSDTYMEKLKEQI